MSSSLPVAAKAGKTRSRANWALASADSQTSTMTTSPDGVSATAWQIRPVGVWSSRFTAWATFSYWARVAAWLTWRTGIRSPPTRVITSILTSDSSCTMLPEMAAVKGERLPRKERARQTRLRMTRAAYQLFTERGYTATTMADIAAAAGVAVQTLYFTFHTKAELLQNVYELAVLGEGDPIPPTEQPWYGEMLAAKRLEEALGLLVDNVTTILARAAPLDDFVRAASLDPDPARVRAHNERLRSWCATAIAEQLFATDTHRRPAP